MPIKTTQDEQPTLNLTPMIDVVFLLIIFFMVGTKFTDDERKIKLEVPEVSQAVALTSAPQKKQINVYRDGSFTLDRQAITLPELTQQLSDAREQYPALGVDVRGDGVGPFQNVASVLNACRQAGIQDLSISVRIARRE